jgi:hypothetical protein
VIVRPDRFIYGAVDGRELSATTRRIHDELQAAPVMDNTAHGQSEQPRHAARISA